MTKQMKEKVNYSGALCTRPYYSLTIQKIVDPELHGFIIPNFSTTTPVDTTIGCVMMMSTLQKCVDEQICKLTDVKLTEYDR